VKLLFTFSVTTFLLCGEVNAQVEHWDTYMANISGKPGSVLVDMGLMAAAPNNKYPNLVVTGPQAKKCNPQGMPDADEIALLEEILTATGNFITGVTPKVLAGTFMYNCQRLNYYYVKDTTGLRNALARVYARTYKDYDYVTKIKHDPEWDVYRTFLYPDEATQNWMENNKVITGMMKQGDSLKTPREVTFNFYFDTDTARNAFEAEVVVKGYATKRKTQSKKKPLLYAIVLSKKSEIAHDVIDKVTAELKEAAKKHNGHYEGWEAPKN
jgi:hypothetical protein